MLSCIRKVGSKYASTPKYSFEPRLCSDYTSYIYFSLSSFPITLQASSQHNLLSLASVSTQVLFHLPTSQQAFAVLAPTVFSSVQRQISPSLIRLQPVLGETKTTPLQRFLYTLQAPQANSPYSKVIKSLLQPNPHHHSCPHPQPQRMCQLPTHFTTSPFDQVPPPSFISFWSPRLVRPQLHSTPNPI